MRIFKNKWFAKFASKEGISDEKLIKAVEDAEAGNIDADYGGDVIKQRIARPGKGKSGGYRSIILYRKENRAFFVYGFAKSVTDNIDRGGRERVQETRQDHAEPQGRRVENPFEEQSA